LAVTVTAMMDFLVVFFVLLGLVALLLPRPLFVRLMKFAFPFSA